MTIREFIFWTVDTLKRGEIKKHLNDINSFFESPKASKTNRALENIIKHAIATTPYYGKYSVFDNFSSFPVIDKSVINNQFHNFKSSEFLNKKLFKVSTSGSTGIPFQLFQDKTKRNRTTADLLYFSKKAGYDIGETLFYLESWRHAKNNNKLAAKIKNLKYIDVSNFEPPQIKAFLKSLCNNNQPKNIIGLPSALECIYQFIVNTPEYTFKPLNIKSIVAVSEHLDIQLKERLQHHFNTNVFSRYSNEEMGILAQQFSTSEHAFALNWASYFFEILELNTNKPVKNGETGRIVITDLYNYSMPLIRYDTGDIGAFSETTTNGYYTLKSIEGRKMDLLYNTNGQQISPHLIHTIFYNYFHLIKQYQFIQEDKNLYTIKLNVLNDFKPHEAALITDLKNDFGQDATIQINYVSEIPLLASGKRKKVLNNYHKALSQSN